MDMKHTGERMIPALSGRETFWEHVERYRFVIPFVTDRQVLDIACGEGYGAASMMRAGAQSVIGIDLSPEACAHAKFRYGIDARVGEAQNIPLDKESVDVVVSFETIEHVPDPAVFLQECRRVLRPGGKLIISTPNKSVYKTITPNNPYHCSEMEIGDFRGLLQVHFSTIRLYGQCSRVPWYWRTRGFGRICNRLQKMLAPELVADMDRKFRQHVVDYIVRPASPFEKITNPWIVQKLSSRKLVESQYVIALST